MTDNKYNTPKDVIEIIKDLQERVRRLETSNPLQRATIDKGYLTLKSPDGQVIAIFGNLNKALNTSFYHRADGSDQMGLMFLRDDGTVAFTIMDDSPDAGYEQFLALWDSSGHIVVSSDADSGFGLALPYVPTGEWVSDDTTQWASTSSTTFVNAMENTCYIQQPKLYIDALAYSTAGTPAVQLTIDGTVYGPVVTGTGTGYTLYNQVITLPSTLLHGWHNIALQMRLAGGTGPVAAAVRGAWGRQT